jgi:hypothetical protein
MTLDTFVLPTDLTFEKAVEVTEAISDALGSMADIYDAALPFIRLSFTGRAWKTLNHRSPAEYVAKYFGDQLSRLGVDMRRDVVRELTAARISAREQAEILGVSHPTVLSDQRATGKSLPVDSTVISRDGRERPAIRPPQPTPPPRSEAQIRQTEIEKGIRTFNFSVAECVYKLAGYDVDRFLTDNYPRHDEFVDDGIRLTPNRIDGAMAFLSALAKAVDHDQH